MSEMSEHREIKQKIKVTMTFDEYKKIRKYFPYDFQIVFNAVTILIVIFFSIGLIPPALLTISDFVMVTLLFVGGLFIILRLIDIFTRNYNYKRIMNGSLDNINYFVFFYDSFLEKKGNDILQRVEYKNIWKIKEIENNVYILIDKNNIIPIPKDSLREDVFDIVKETVKHNNKKAQILKFSTRKMEKNKKTKIFLNMLFLLTIASLWIGLYVMVMLIEKNNAPAPLMFKYTWGLLFVLPIPVLSIIFGLFYNKKGIKSVKNIVAGIIISLILISVGSISFAMNYEIEYSEIYSYANMLQVNIPKEGEFNRIEWDESYLQEHISEYITFINKSETKTLYYNISNNEIWILKDKISSNLSNFIPDSVFCESKDEPCYYSVYIKELNIHNTIPTNTGNYHVYAMMYDPSTYTLSIERFLYEYKN